MVAYTSDSDQHSLWSSGPDLHCGLKPVSETAHFRLSIGALADKDSEVTHYLSREDQCDWIDGSTRDTENFGEYAAEPAIPDSLFICQSDLP